MKKSLLLTFLAGGLFLCSGEARAQIDYSDDFDGTESSWPENEFYETSEFSCDSESYRVLLYGGFFPNTSAETVSSAIGTSNGGLVTLSYDYKVILTDDPYAPAQNEDNWGNFTVYYATSDTGPFTVLETIDTSNHVESANCATRTVTFTPANDNEVYLKIVTNLGAVNNHISIYFDNFTAVQEASEPCDTEAPEAEASQTVCGGSTIGDLEAEGDTIVWYSAAEGGEPLSEDTGLEDGVSYFAAQIPNGSCESEGRTEVVVTLNEVPQPEVDDVEQDFCGMATLGDLNVQTTDPEGILVWYDAETEGNELPVNGELVDGGVYYVAQIVAGCEGKRVGITAEINITPEPEAESPQIITGEAPLTANLYEDIEVTAEGDITWYATEEDAEAGENPLPEGTVITEGGTYYVTQAVEGCESAPVAVEVQMVLGNGDFDTGAFSYYPNPVERILTLSYTDAITEVEVYNMLGQKIVEKDSSGNMMQLDMSGFAPGTYIINVTSGDKTHRMKVLKK